MEHTKILNGNDLLKSPLITKTYVCAEAIKWLRSNKEKSILELWSTCPEPDWMMWVLTKKIRAPKWPGKEKIQRILLRLVEQYALPHTSQGYEYCYRAVMTAYLHLKNLRDTEELRTAIEKIDAGVETSEYTDTTIHAHHTISYACWACMRTVTNTNYPAGCAVRGVVRTMESCTKSFKDPKKEIAYWIRNEVTIPITVPTTDAKL